MKFKVIKLKFKAEEDDFYGRPEGDILWPNHFSQEEIDEIQSDPGTFQALFQQEPQAQEGGWFNNEWLADCIYDVGKLEPDKLNKYILVDPALSTKSKGNFTAMVVIGLGADRNYYVLQLFRDRVDPYQRADALFRLVRKWRPIKVGYEAYGMNADVPYLKERMEQKNQRFKIVELGKTGSQHNLSKKDRIRQLIPTFREGRIWLPREQLFVDSNKNELDLIEIFVDTEYARYPSSTYDDLLDCLARIHDDQMGFEWPLDDADEYIEQDASGGGSWVIG